MQFHRLSESRYQGRYGVFKVETKCRDESLRGGVDVNNRHPPQQFVGQSGKWANDAATPTFRLFHEMCHVALDLTRAHFFHSIFPACDFERQKSSCVSDLINT